MTDALLLKVLFGLASSTFLLALYIARQMIDFKSIIQKHEQTLYGANGGPGVVRAAEDADVRLRVLERFLDIDPALVRARRSSDRS